jgi:predicted MFS family arabinose efflux permease
LGYRALYGDRRARRILIALGAAWLSFGMVGLAVFLSVQRATSSVSAGGLAVAGFSLGSGALAPLRGRLLDRRGTRPLLLLFAVGYAASLGLLALAAALEGPAALLIACAGTAGASAPPLVASLRGQWARAFDRSLLRRAYALASLVGDVGLVAAPALGGLLFAMAPSSPLAVAAVAALASAAVAAPEDEPSSQSTEPRQTRSPLASGGFRRLLAVSVALGAALGLVEVAVPAAATRWHVAAFSGFLLGCFALGSVVGGLWFGRRDWRRPSEQRYLLAVVVLAVALAPPLVATAPAELAPLLLAAGLAFGPATIALFEALDVLAPDSAIESLTWVTTAEALGTAMGATASGFASARVGTWAPYAIASAVLSLASGLALARTRGTTAAS